MRIPFGAIVASVALGSMPIALYLLAIQLWGPQHGVRDIAILGLVPMVPLLVIVLIPAIRLWWYPKGRVLGLILASVLALLFIGTGKLRYDEAVAEQKSWDEQERTALFMRSSRPTLRPIVAWHVTGALWAGAAVLGLLVAGSPESQTRNRHGMTSRSRV